MKVMSPNMKLAHKVSLLRDSMTQRQTQMSLNLSVFGTDYAMVLAITKWEGTMKFISIITLIVLTGLTAHSNINNPKLKITAPKGVYLPQGFDSNDNVEIIFDGYYSNACFRAGLSTVHVDQELQKIYVSDSSLYYGHDFCAAVIVPYSKVTDAGILKPGHYSVLFQHSRENFVESGYMQVVRATTENKDDHLYANVEKIRYIASHPEHGPHLVLNGSHTNTCQKVDYINVNQNPESNVVEVLPIALMERGGCEHAPNGIPFEAIAQIDELPPGKHLIHTRILNGRSTNEIVTVY